MSASGSFKRLLAVIALALMPSCAPFIRPEAKPAPLTFVKTGAIPDLTMDLTDGPIVSALERSIEALAAKDPAALITVGGMSVTNGDIDRSARRLLEIIHIEKDPAKRIAIIQREFGIYRYAQEPSGVETLFTGYYLPFIRASREKTDSYKWPIYALPEDLVTADLGLFHNELKGRKITGRVENGKLAPYHDRQAIDLDGALAARGLEIAWANDPFDLFVMSVQGSGRAVFEDGSSVFLNYAGSNGRAYRSIGKTLIERGAVKKEDMSLNAIRRWTDENPEKMFELLFTNPSYVFYRAMEDGPFGSTGVKLTAGRSVAVDPAYYPEHAILLVSLDLPEVKDGVVMGWKQTARLAIAQDRGGAIKGPGRMDIYFGEGPEAGATAGLLKQTGPAYFLILKSTTRQ
ncbi:MAG: MltA domain-containing protein [Nitrospinae bacterium]|nr:MltA domain-containing protein [Nitrospinota bacterium]